MTQCVLCVRARGSAGAVRGGRPAAVCGLRDSRVRAGSRGQCATLVVVGIGRANLMTDSIFLTLVLAHPGLLGPLTEIPVFAAALLVEDLGVLAAVGDPIDAFVESMARIGLIPVL